MCGWQAWADAHDAFAQDFACTLQTPAQAQIDIFGDIVIGIPVEVRGKGLSWLGLVGHEINLHKEIGNEFDKA